MEPLWTIFLTSFGSFLAGSSTFWIYLKNRDQSREANTKLLMGLAQDKISHLGIKYIERGWITFDEFEHLQHYLYDPYVALGGNGTSSRIMSMVTNLPIHPEKEIYQGGPKNEHSRPSSE